MKRNTQILIAFSIIYKSTLSCSVGMGILGEMLNTIGNFTFGSNGFCLTALWGAQYELASCVRISELICSTVGAPPPPFFLPPLLIIGVVLVLKSKCYILKGILMEFINCVKRENNSDWNCRLSVDCELYRAFFFFSKVMPEILIQVSASVSHFIKWPLILTSNTHSVWETTCCLLPFSFYNQMGNHFLAPLFLFYYFNSSLIWGDR